MWRGSGEPADSFYAVRPECSDVTKTRFKIKAGRTLSVRRWHAAFSPDGCLDISQTLGRIQRGGVHPSIRGEVWEFLLGCFDPRSSFDELRTTETTKEEVGLDVLRTDRTLVFYEKQENLSKLWDILAVYAWIDKDVGYCQGMSDLCSPMIILLEDEADAFWCFERLMRRLRGNFRCTETSVGVENQLQSLASITRVLYPKLHQHLETLGGGDYLFAFRMFMVLFRRELSFGDSLYLWEMMWALEYDPGIFSMYEEPGFTGEK
ncbi:hypothetical protein J5N97_011477 [Dioscorea zingiberensis]|uniref:Rab-GAP TBC domain-containing protein n=1 Tax=Dioscorea zingiberensis TaxID=325984 RepID=A0A9D5HPL9_9LILI|nr:hypothetical protein J5N97_011477 [Dioscorea zingiberensis]